MRSRKTMDRNRFVDILKGILIIFVIVLHSDIPTDTRLVLGFPFGVSMAVPMFMLISGYVSALSLKGNGEHAVEKAYEPRQFLKKLLRFVIPFGFAFAAQWIIFRIAGLYLVGIREYGVFALLLDFIRGGKGPGSYYFPIMLQFVFLFPAVYYVIKRYDLKGLVGCFLGNGIFEVLKIAFGMGDYEYRFLIFRYMFLIAAGCYFVTGNYKRMKKLKLFALNFGCIVVGLGFCYLFSYTDYAPKIVTYWKETSFIACLYLVPLFALLLTRVHIRCKPLELVGRASFNIFLVQMIYYNFMGETREWFPDIGVHVFVSILFCVAVGVLFYCVESRLTKWVCDKIGKMEK